MVDISVKAWVCHAPGRHLADVLLPVNISDEEQLSQSEEDMTPRGEPVLLQQTEEGSPCVLMLSCSSDSPTAISRLLVTSQARTMEVYSHTGEYCGTVRGERDSSYQPDSADSGPFYRKQLILENPSSACEVKLLSLSGRNRVLLAGILVGLRRLQPGPAPGPGINMQQVQSLVDQMGTSLSPGAQNLLDMVHFQQKKQVSSLDGLLPLLMGAGAFSALAPGASISPAAVRKQPADPTLSQCLSSSVRPDVVNSSTSAPPPQDLSLSASHTRNTGTNTRGPASCGQLAAMMSHLLKGPEPSQALSPGPELLPMLQRVCGQVTQLRLEDAAAAAEAEKTLRNGTWELDTAMERRLEEMEKRLKEHVDRRLDALEQKLEKALLSALPLVALNQGGIGGSVGGAAPARPAEQAATTPAVH